MKNQIPEGQKWNVSFIAIIFTFDFQKPLDLEEIAKKLQKLKEKNEGNIKATFIPWEDSPISIFDEKNKKYENYKDFNEIGEKWKSQSDISPCLERHKLFIAATGSEKTALDKYYLKNKKFVRLKLPDVEIKFCTKPLNQKMNAEVHFLIHRTGIIVGTLYVQPKEDLSTLSTYQIIEFERRVKGGEVKINDGNQEMELDKYLLNKLREEEIIKEPKGSNCRPRIKYVVSIKKYPIFLRKLIKPELYGIMNVMRGWYQLREGVELKELYGRKDFYIFVGAEASLFISSEEFEEDIVNKSIELFRRESTSYTYGKWHFLYTLREYFEHYVVTPIEFASIVDRIQERYFYEMQNLPEGYTKFTDIIKEFLENIQECDNITFMEARPIWKIMKYEEKTLETPKKMEDVRNSVLALTSLIQQETQNKLTIVFGLLTIFSVAELVWEITNNLTLTKLLACLFSLVIVVGLVGIRATLHILKTALKQLLSDFCSFYNWLRGNCRKVEDKLREDSK
jgi:sulfur relay (sulfurtransferase) DsrC/TusE family protein